MQVKSVDFSIPEARPRAQQAGLRIPVVTQCGAGFVTSFSAHPVVLCGPCDVIGRPADWSLTDRCVSRDQELQEPVDLSLRRDDDQSPASSSLARLHHHPSSPGSQTSGCVRRARQVFGR